MRSLVIGSTLAVLLGVVGFLATRGDALEFYETRPALERPVPLQRVPKGLKSLSAQECGTCHVEIYREWRQSAHAQAWTDPQYQGELHKDPAVNWLCINCHTPLVNQLDSLVVRLEGGDVSRPVRRANPAFNAALREEGITCASCHVRDGVVLGPFKDAQAPHAVRYDPTLRTTEVCERCHQATMVYPGKTFVCVFKTGDEWRAGPHAAEGQICQDCHMPAVTRPLVAGGPPRRTGRHGWIGSRLKKGDETAPALWDSLAALIEPGIALSAGSAPAARTGGTAAWRVTARNAAAGHMLPTGDPERAVIVRLALIGASGDTLARTSHRIGQRYEWYPEVKKLGDTRLAPGDSVVVTLRYRVPRGAHRLVASAVNERISDEAADYHGLTRYPRRVEVARLERSRR
jgi:hypothetical protein